MPDPLNTSIKKYLLNLIFKFVRELLNKKAKEIAVVQLGFKEAYMLSLIHISEPTRRS